MSRRPKLDVQFQIGQVSWIRENPITWNLELTQADKRGAENQIWWNKDDFFGSKWYKNRFCIGCPRTTSRKNHTFPPFCFLTPIKNKHMKTYRRLELIDWHPNLRLNARTSEWHRGPGQPLTSSWAGWSCRDCSLNLSPIVNQSYTVDLRCIFNPRLLSFRRDCVWNLESGGHANF